VLGRVRARPSKPARRNGIARMGPNFLLNTVNAQSVLILLRFCTMRKPALTRVAESNTEEGCRRSNARSCLRDPILHKAVRAPARD
jgi:hypothetical protein